MSVTALNIWTDIQKLFTSIGFADIADIVVVTIAVFYMLRLFRRTRTGNFLRGLLLLVVIYAVVIGFGLPTSAFAFKKVFSNIVIVMVILFSPEIRRGIEEFGRGQYKSVMKIRSGKRREKTLENISAVVNACVKMSGEKIGALIVFEGRTPMSAIRANGQKISGEISKELIENIFFPKAPLHDGAVIIKGGRIETAGSILPLTEQEVSTHLGTRHRAAIGASEAFDCLCVVVSEETGHISTAKNGKLTEDISSGELFEILESYLLPKEKKEAKR